MVEQVTYHNITKNQRQLPPSTTNHSTHNHNQNIRNGFMPHIMGHKLAHIYAREVR